MANTRMPVLTAEETAAFVEDVFPQQKGVYRIAAIAPMTARVTQSVRYQDLRPGGSVSGPTLFALADVSFYIAVLAMIGRQEMAVTSNLSINFMRRPPEADLWAEARILKLGRTLATGDVVIGSDGVVDPVAHASVTYALPRNAG